MRIDRVFFKRSSQIISRCIQSEFDNVTILPPEELLSCAFFEDPLTLLLGSEGSLGPWGSWSMHGWSVSQEVTLCSNL